MSAYARLLRVPHVAVLLTATIVIRLPFAINGLAVILFLREIGESFATAGLVAGALALGSAAGAPAAARLVDRRGVGMLLPLAVLQAAAVLSIWVLGTASASGAVLAVAGLVAGAAFPPPGRFCARAGPTSSPTRPRCAPRSRSTPSGSRSRSSPGP